MNKLLSTAAALGLFASAAAIPQPAMAQGTVGPTPEIGRSCPSGYADGGGRASTSADMCYPINSSAPAVYANPSRGKCASGYVADGKWCSDKPASTATAAPTFGNLAKANALDRCPVGYYTDRDNTSACVSYYQNKSPASRAKRGGACAANEIDEWGLWCTSKTTSLTRAEAEDSAISDVNSIYENSRGQGATQGGEYENTPGIIGIFGRNGGDGSASAASSSGSSNSVSTTQGSAQCTTGSSSGASVGGALAGDAGAALGSMLGGLGKKKKKKEGC